MTIAIMRDVAGLRVAVAGWRGEGRRIALVPTMGALHDGHLALVTAARRAADRVIVTIFVNPTQFAPHEDFAAYPRDLQADCAKVEAAGADLVFAPSRAVMYPDSFATTVNVGGPALAGLEDRFRPAHFAGVATVVAKLLQQAQPDIAVFGQKDFQQLRVIERMVRDLDMPIAIEGVPTVREQDGLALSSRNAYLAPDERDRAPVLHREMARCARAIQGGADIASSLAAAREAIASAGFLIDYVEARQADSLEALEVAAPAAVPIRILVAARLGATRLIDNAPSA